MAKGPSYAVPATPTRGEDRADYDLTPCTEDLVTTGRSVRFEDTEFDHAAKDEDDHVDDELEDKAPVQKPDLHEEPDVFVTKSGGVKSLSRNLADEFEEAGKPEPAHDDIDELNDDLKKSSTMTRGASQLTTKKDGNRPPINEDTPLANKTLGQCLNAMLDTSSWIQLFAPKAARQAVWAELVEELSHPVNSTSTTQVAEDTVSLLMAMGMEAHAYPSSTALADWTAGTELQRWKRRLKTAFGSKDVGARRRPVARSAGERVNSVNIRLARTPKKTTRAVLCSAEQSSYSHDSHLITPRLENHKARSTANTRPDTGRRSSRRQAPGDDSSSDENNPFYQNDDENDATTELTWQIRELT
ncbi:Eukaryotic/viral aspartic protease [Phytophthora megakarya]|uniref:Eukaryotic/viral aspartic protease n=1 Tax=Phytophthora megakarya TaxID=4795 RepID=A0A225VLI7_9STRA|nr:Eukaryotic/viral aspartic protease [Phytophthora megakarya]